MKTDKKAKKNIVNDVLINVVSTRKVMQGGISSLVKDTDKSGISIITSYNRPVCMVLSLSVMGMKNALKQIEKLYSEIEVEDDIVAVTMQEMLNNAVKIIGAIDEKEKIEKK